jgi:hypothetical protein
MDEQMVARQLTKTAEHHFVRTLKEEFQFAPRVAEAVLAEAQESLMSGGKEPGMGQIRVFLSRRQAGHGQALDKTASQEVLWTINAGSEDQQVLVEYGRESLRRVRIVRLLDEALEQGAAATQEDLAMALNVGVRTIKRDCKVLAGQGVYLPTRGNLQGIGRGQTHKALIVGRWLRGETYDQLMLNTRHSLTCIRRYIQYFLRIVELHEQGFSLNQIARLVEQSEALVQEYLAVYHQNSSPECRERLAEQLTRLRKANGRPSEPKKGEL